MLWRQAKTCDITAAVLLIAVAAFRLWYGGTHELVSDEAYYWQWSRHLDYGYYDNTPLVAYVIKLFTALFGSNEFGVRSGAVACVLGMSTLVYLLAKRLFSLQIALVSVAVLNIVPLAADASFLMTCDPPQLLFWAATVYVAWHAIEKQDKRGLSWALWLLTGVLAGATIMAKLNGAIILPAIFLYLVLSPTARPLLKRPEPYIAAIIALAIFYPFQHWNQTHENAYWLHGHQMSQRGRDKPNYPIRGFGDFLGAQAILISPLLYLTYLRLVPKLRDGVKGTHPDSWLYLWCTSVTVTLVTVAVSFHNKVEGNWAVAAYVTGIVMIGAAIADSWLRPGPRIWHSAGIALSLLLSTVAFVMPQLARPLHLKSKMDRATEMVGWRQLASRVAAEQSALGGPAKCFAFGLNYRLPSQLAFYLPGQPVTYSMALDARANNYMFWEDPNKRIGDNAVFVNDSDDTDGLKECRAIFQRVDVAPPLSIWESPYKEPIRTVQVFRCYGFKGYDRKRWQDGW
jgi:4-amino-4-deoxy-L-arabinose transferase-like glycosyltransferase